MQSSHWCHDQDCQPDFSLDHDAPCPALVQSSQSARGCLASKRPRSCLCEKILKANFFQKETSSYTHNSVACPNWNHYDHSIKIWHFYPSSLARLLILAGSTNNTALLWETTWPMHAAKNICLRPPNPLDLPINSLFKGLMLNMVISSTVVKFRMSFLGYKVKHLSIVNPLPLAQKCYKGSLTRIVQRWRLESDPTLLSQPILVSAQRSLHIWFHYGHKSRHKRICFGLLRAFEYDTHAVGVYNMTHKTT